MNKIALIVAVLALLVGAFGVFSPVAKQQVLQGLQTINPQVFGSSVDVQGVLTEGGGVKTITPVAATYTLTAADLRDSNVVTFVASTTMPALTLALTASTTFPLGTNAGAKRSWIVENPFTAAATTTTISAGTGIDLQEPDGQNVVVGINNYAWLTCFREASSDIVCSVDETIPAD